MKRLWAFVFFLLPIMTIPHTGYAERQTQVFSPEAMLAIATYEKIYSFSEDYVEVHLGREISATYFRESSLGIRYKYTISSRYLQGESWEETCLVLPEIGEWSIEGYSITKMENKRLMNEDIVFKLKCILYNSSDEIIINLPTTYGELQFQYKNNQYTSFNWYCWHYGSRPSTENLGHIRFAKENLFSKSQAGKTFEIFAVRDMRDIPFRRATNNYDDIFFYIKKAKGKVHPADLNCYIVPRIFFVDLEKKSIHVSLNEIIPKVRFTIIVQQFENPEKTAWNYHRLEIHRDHPTREIQINDLGPLPRSEWAPGWPDPATTPLWKAPEDACAQCE